MLKSLVASSSLVTARVLEPRRSEDLGVLSAREVSCSSIQCSCCSGERSHRTPLWGQRLSVSSAGAAQPLVNRSVYVAAVLDVPAGPGQAGEQQETASRVALSGAGGGLILTPYRTAEERIHEAVVKEAASVERASSLADVKALGSLSSPEVIDDAYTRCGEVCAEYAKTFYLGTQLMTPERRRAIWAIYVWCRRTDELVDGPNAPRITPRALDRWEERLEDVFAGRPYDMLDAALADTVQNYPMKIQPFRDMVEGMRMDLRKSRYANFDELYLYCYNVAGTVGLMSVPVMGIDPKSQADPVDVYGAALALGIANQLTNILRDVGEDARRGRIYLPQDELEMFNLSDADIMEGRVTDNWRAFMKFQIKRARHYFTLAEKGVSDLSEQSRWPVWASLSLYRQILESVEANDYDNFTKRAYVRKWKKLVSLPGAYFRAKFNGPQVQPAEDRTVSAVNGRPT
eukprot:TRINITY_DN19941_c0_g1_i1.p1 TRINITY_DN19941_c0_g1~~TRINITY_DN19941_c0_g1_i1.p1  ORF type:complete len:459 (-),score=55.54 TRINITY_DN19941_c0_g1_i1:1151-2527(-)